MKHAIILCGGKGTRLRPYTLVLPKPLMPIGDFPILEVIIRQLKSSGFKSITLAVNHQASLFKAFFEDGSKWGLNISYVDEDKELGTMGPLKLVSNLPNHFLVMNGDVLTDVNYGEFLDSHIESKRIFTISSFNRKHKVDFGVLKRGDENNLVDFIEKPNYDFEVSMGVYAVNKSILKYIPEDKFFGFDHLMRTCLREGLEVGLRRHDGLWLDIGRPDDYVEAIDLFEKHKENFINKT